MKKITGLLIDVNTGKASFKTVDKSLESYYKILDCSTIDIVNRRIGENANMRFDIICDDEALLVAPSIPSALSGVDFNDCLYGNLFVVGHDPGSEDVRSLTKEEIKYLRNYHIIFFVPSRTNAGTFHVNGLTRVYEF